MNVEKNTNEVDELCEQMTAKVLSIVLNEFPEKIKEIDKLRQNFEWKSILTLKTANMQWITNIVDRLIIKQCCNIDIDEILSPKIQDGHNFGVLVQTKAMYYMADVYHSCCGQLLTLESYYSRRRSSLNYCMLNPQLIDYQIAHNEIERDTMYTLCSTINQLYHFYAGINDFVEKNLQKLIQPRD
nr:proteasome activator complex subunit 3-like [Dermatophagoides farinae]